MHGMAFSSSAATKWSTSTKFFMSVSKLKNEILECYNDQFLSIPSTLRIVYILAFVLVTLVAIHGENLSDPTYNFCYQK
jgi:hypothetical protein